MKIKIGIFFGGFSREREISFAGGRTVYDNLNKSLFEAIPVFVDSFGHFILMDWTYIYKGSIRDFYPAADDLPVSENSYQVYAESISDDTLASKQKLGAHIGTYISPSELKQKIDFAFLCLHGPFGEDGTIQGLLDFYEIPYSGSGVYPSAIGIDKVLQKKLMAQFNFKCPEYVVIEKHEWLSGDKTLFFENAKQNVKFPMVVKSSTQGSSIGISILKENELSHFIKAVNKSFFIYDLTVEEWKIKSKQEQIEWVRHITDIREGIAIPLQVTTFKKGKSIAAISINHPEVLLAHLRETFNMGSTSVLMEALDGESKILIEAFINGKEFSCIVLENEEGEHDKVMALPPTEIRKGDDLFDYRSKYLPGLARKITPINLPEKEIEKIASLCVQLFEAFNFDVYARIDGFINDKGEVFLNDPNTTSGMMPSSFFFHQAAEIGLNPSQFLTYIISTSLRKRTLNAKNKPKVIALYHQLRTAILKNNQGIETKIKVGVIMGGYSSERHISIESGRNIYEKLASSEKYFAIPIFLTGSNEVHKMYSLPVNILLKDNADDIKEKVEQYHVHPFIKTVKSKATAINKMYAGKNQIEEPSELSYKELKEKVNVVFIALHGRPGEDGAVQQHLNELHIPFNGSGVRSSQTTINKYLTNEILMQHGLKAAKHRMIANSEWHDNKQETIDTIETSFGYPFIAKPVDDGCSSAVRKIKNRDELEAFAHLIFRKEIQLILHDAATLKVKLNEEFPQKKEFLIEELIDRKNAIHFLEVTGGLLTSYNKKNEIEFEIFEASEALAEGEILSLEEKFLAGQGQNITPARYSKNKEEAKLISQQVKNQLQKAAEILNIQGYARIDAFVRIFENAKAEVIFIEVNSLPGMTPATCIFHQTAINGYKPYDFIDKILSFGMKRKELVGAVE